MTTLSMTIPDAVRVSGMSRSKIYESLKNGTLKARKAGRRTLIPADELARYLNDLPAYSSGA